MTADTESRLVFGHVLCEQRGRHVDIKQDTALGTADMVVSIGALVEAAGLVAEWELQDQPALGEQVQRPVDSSVRDRRITSVDTFEDLPRGEMTVGGTNSFQNRCALWRHSEATMGSMYGFNEIQCLGHR